MTEATGLPKPQAVRRTPVDALVGRRLGIGFPFQREELERAQLKALRQTLDYARKHSPFYRRRLAGLDVDSIRTSADLCLLPTLAAQHLAESGPQLLCLSQGRVARVMTLATSGSTGSPKRLFFAEEDLAATRDFFLHGMHSLINRDDRVLILLPCATPDSVGDLLRDVLEHAGIPVWAVWPPQKAAALCRRRNISCVVGLPHHLLALAEDMGPGTLQSMLLCSDYAAPALRHRIARACGCETFLHYGATESGLGGAVECGMHDGCHIRESDLLIEIVDPDSGRSVAGDTPGEVVLTTLGHRAMPLIRYKTGDQARITRAVCACGGVTARLIDIRGRIAGCRLPDGSLLTSQDLDDRLFTIPGLRDYRASLRAGGRLHIEFTATPGAEEVDQAVSRTLLQIPAIRDTLNKGQLSMGEIRRVENFAAAHTFKRTLHDHRTQEGMHANHP